MHYLFMSLQTINCFIFSPRYIGKISKPRIYLIHAVSFNMKEQKRTFRDYMLRFSSKDKLLI